MVCPTHGRLLVDVCPACGVGVGVGVGVGYGNARGSAGLSRYSLAPPKKCAAHSSRGVCDARLDEIATDEATATLLRAQQRLVGTLDGEEATLAGQRISGRDWVAALSASAEIVRGCADADIDVDAPEVCRAASPRWSPVVTRTVAGGPGARRRLRWRATQAQ